MKKLSLTGCLLLVAFAAQAAEGAHWSYSGEEGPENWAKLTPEYGACAGKNQSPIDLTGFIEADLKRLKVNYHANGNEIVNNGHTVQVNFGAGSWITLNDVRYDLKQFHFHAPSENLIEGKSFPMEGHLVHADKDGNLAVVAVMYVEGKENRVLAKAWPQMPKNAGDKAALAAPLNPRGLLPDNQDYYRFNGSLTTPPCTEGVRWLVMKAPVSASKEQIEEFAHVMHHPNNRPVQAVNARPVLR